VSGYPNIVPGYGHADWHSNPNSDLFVSF